VRYLEIFNTYYCRQHSVCLKSHASVLNHGTSAEARCLIKQCHDGMVNNLNNATNQKLKTIKQN